MHASGAIASKIAPFAVFAAVYLPHRAAGYDLFPSWSLWAVLAIGVVQIVTDIPFSTKKHSDWKRSAASGGWPGPGGRSHAPAVDWVEPGSSGRPG